MNTTDLRNQFPVLERYTYLNTASSGLISLKQQAWRAQYDQLFVQTGSKFRDALIPQLDGVRDTVSRVFDLDAEQVALIPNFSIGLNLLVESLDSRLSVLAIQNDYPSLTLPFKSRGFAIKEVPLFDLSEAGIATRIKEHSIDILAISMTQWVTGITFSQDFFARLRQDFPDLLIIVDGTQSLGTSPFSFRESGIDILLTSAYKWLMGGYGCGFMACSDRAQDRLSIKSTGNATEMVRMLSGRSYKMQLFEPGHLDYRSMHTMQMGLELIGSIGLSEVERRISKVSLHAKAQLVNMGMISPSSLGGAIHRGIIHLISSERLVNFLSEHGIVVSYRDGLRMSIHFYNTEADVNRLLAAMRVFR